MFLKKFLSRDFLFKNFYLKFKKDTYYKESNKYFYGSLKFWRILFINILNPGRFLMRLKYGQIFINKKKILLKFKNSLNAIKDNDYQNTIGEEKFSKLSNGIQKLIDDGGVVIHNYFTEKEIDEFVNSNKEIISKLKSSENISNNAKYYYEIIKLNKQLKKFWYDPGLIKMLESFFGKKIYARNYPNIKYTQVPKNYNTSKIASDWHVDHSLMFNIFILLEDVEKDGTRMQIIKGSHKYLNTGNFMYSENSVKDFETINFYGKKGSIHIHTGNTIHRAKLSSGKNRLNLYFEYTLGPNILLNSSNLSKSLDDNFDIENLENLNFEEREFLKGIFPKPLAKGYEVKKDSLNSTSYKGI
tara:strand:- start:514 stop:1584 length:1071 start_codon:yes stop_codon:yes gene_type:complete